MELDRFSYLCGAMDAFAELVHAGVKQLALSHPCASLAERDALLPFAHGLCEKYDILCQPEDDLLITDLFPARENAGKPLILLFAHPETLAAYRSLKAEKAALLARGVYEGEARRNIARGFGRLLSYDPARIEEAIDANQDRE